MAKQLDSSQQWNDIEWMKGLLAEEEITLLKTADRITVQKGTSRKNLEVYPAMWKKKDDNQTIYLNDIYARFARPYAFEKVLKAMAK